MAMISVDGEELTRLDTSSARNINLDQCETHRWSTSDRQDIWGLTPGPHNITITHSGDIDGLGVSASLVLRGFS